MLYAIIAVLALIIDQAIKYWTSANIVLNSGTKNLIPGFIHLSNVHNTGAAFSFLEGARWFFVLLCIVFTVAVIYMLAKKIIDTPAQRWLAVLVLAGALGNCIDRIISGYVVDMFEFDFMIFGNRFPVFNFADILITCGGILFCFFVILEDSGKTEKQPKAKKAPKAERKAVEAAEDAEDSNVFEESVEIEPEVIERSTPKPAEKSVEAPKPEPKPEPKPVEAPKAPEKPKAEPADDISLDEFDLDSILNEFKDL